MLVLYDYDSNYIAVEPLKDRKATTILTAHSKLYNAFISAGWSPAYRPLTTSALKSSKPTSRMKKLTTSSRPLTSIAAMPQNVPSHR